MAPSQETTSPSVPLQSHRPPTENNEVSEKAMPQSSAKTISKAMQAKYKVMGPVSAVAQAIQKLALSVTEDTLVIAEETLPNGTIVNKQYLIKPAHPTPQAPPTKQAAPPTPQAPAPALPPQTPPTAHPPMGAQPRYLLLSTPHGLMLAQTQGDEQVMGGADCNAPSTKLESGLNSSQIDFNPPLASTQIPAMQADTKPKLQVDPPLPDSQFNPPLASTQVPPDVKPSVDPSSTNESKQDSHGTQSPLLFDSEPLELKKDIDKENSQVKSEILERKPLFKTSNTALTAVNSDLRETEVKEESVIDEDAGDFADDSILRTHRSNRSKRRRSGSFKNIFNKKSKSKPVNFIEDDDDEV